MNFTEESHPEAYKLLRSFHPSAQKPHPGRFYSKAYKSLLASLGLLAWGKRDRATAVKHYREVIDLADSHPPFNSLPPGMVGMEKYVHDDLLQGKDNLGKLVLNDTMNAEMAVERDGNGDEGTS